MTTTDTEAYSPSRFISITRARCIARYKMRNVPGRPEELEKTAVLRASMAGVVGTRRVISFGYIHGQIRIRKHDGRKWVETRDIQLRDGWLDEVYEFLDAWMGSQAPPTPRPIRDDPQA